MYKLNAKQLRTSEVDVDIARSIKKHPVSIVLDNVLDTYNVGAIFRLADAVAAEKVYLCGETLTPPNSRIKKASINTWQWVDWEYHETALHAAHSIKEKNPETKIVSIEQDDRSQPFQSFSYTYPLAIVVGHESNGVTREVLNMSDAIIELPMWGINVSLNVMVSCGIILYEIMRQKSELHETQ
jgi:tRNA G18 (ribose-2'-O)-methylase SpoU